MKTLYIICHTLWSNKARVAILGVQIFLACLVFNVLLCRFMYVDQVRQLIWSSNVEHALLFCPEVRFGQLIENKRHNVTPESSQSCDVVYNKMKEQIGNYPGIAALGTIRHNNSANPETEAFITGNSGDRFTVKYNIYDEVLINNLHLPLAQGELTDLLKKGDKLPAIVSWPLAQKYGGMGAQIPFTVLQQGREYTVCTTVAGILEQDYFTYQIPGGGSADGLKLLNSMARRHMPDNNDYTFILPPFLLSDGSTPFGIQETGIICFVDEYVDTDKALMEWNKAANEDGLGRFISFPQLNTNQVEFTLKQNQKMAWLGIMILLVAGVGIGGFNFLRLIRDKRNTAIYFMSGMDWAAYMRLEVIKNFIIVSIPACLALLVTKVFFVAYRDNPNKMFFSPANVLGTFLIILLFVIGTTILFHLMTKEKNIVTLMRKDEE